MKKIAVSASLMCADLLDMRRSLKELEAVGADYLHIDIMDGSFVPNFTFGTDFCKKVREESCIPLDIHLMITDPLYKLSGFAFGEGDIVSVHYESCYDVHRVLCRIKDRGAKALLALNPATPPEAAIDCMGIADGLLIMTVNPGFAGQKLFPGAVEKVRRASALTGEARLLAVDGNVSFETAPLLRAAGAELFVAGSSSLFSNEASLSENMVRLKGI